MRNRNLKEFNTVQLKQELEDARIRLERVVSCTACVKNVKGYIQMLNLEINRRVA